MRQLLMRPQDRASEALGDPEVARVLLAMLTDVHCFEITAAMPLYYELVKIARAPGGDEAITSLLRTAVFMPAPKTWIEHLGLDKGHRTAVLLVNSPWGIQATMFAKGHPPGFLGNLSTGTGINPPGAPRLPDCIVNLPTEVSADMRALVGIYLAMINSPKVVSRQQHEPHKGLAREVRQHRNLGQPFALLPWHEIKLQVTKPRYIDDGEPHADQITGKRALHFVRRFMRIRLGKLEYVTAHWRGDPALGVHQSDYRVSV